MSDIEDIKRIIENTKVDILGAFCYQGPPSKNWLKTEGRFWDGWNTALDKVLDSIDKQKERTPP